MSQILILGAGLSGLSAARELQNAGHDVVLVDKGRGIGGRMATRRAGDATFDHGAQFFTARSDEFKTELESWKTAGVAAHWFDGFPSPNNEKPNDHHPRFRGTKGMTGIAKHLAQNLDVRLEEEIESLARENGVWSAISKSGNTFRADKLLLTAPAPQALGLFDSSSETLPETARETLENLRYEPCFAVLCVLRGASNIPAPGLFYVNGDPIWWIADNFQKGVSKQAGAVTIHSSGTFARAHYDDDSDEIARVLIDESRAWLGSEVESYQVRRWRYSKPENPLEIGALNVPELNLCFAGDALNGAKIEGAWRSGIEAAKHLL